MSALTEYNGTVSRARGGTVLGHHACECFQCTEALRFHQDTHGWDCACHEPRITATVRTVGGETLTLYHARRTSFS